MATGWSTCLCTATCIFINHGSQHCTWGSGHREGNISIWAHSHQDEHCQRRRATCEAACSEQHPTVQVACNIIVGCHACFFWCKHTADHVFCIKIDDMLRPYKPLSGHIQNLMDKTMCLRFTTAPVEAVATMITQ